MNVDTSEAPAKLRYILDGDWPETTQLVRLGRELIAADRLTQHTTALFDLRLVKKLPNYIQLHELVVASAAAPWPLRRAYLVQTPVQYGVVRQLQALADKCLEIHIFWDEADAYDWYGLD